MKQPFLKKYQPKFLKEFFMEPAYIQLIKALIKMNNLNILLIGNTGCGKTSLLDAIIREYYNTPKMIHLISSILIIYRNKVFHTIEMKLRPFAKQLHQSLVKKK